MDVRPRSRHLVRPRATALLLGTLALGLSSVPAIAQTFEDQVMEIVNVERWNNGQLPPLKRSALLDASSEGHSVAMADRNFFAHCDLDTGTKPWDRMTAAGYTGWAFAGENIAAGYATPSAVMTAWMNSTGHRANILSTNSREIGIGYFQPASDQSNVRGDSNGDCTADGSLGGPYTRYWTQNFGRRNTVYPVVVNREAWQVTNAVVDLYVYGSGWAQEMRFRNESGAWSAWQPWAANTTWILSAGNGTKTVNCEIRNGATVYAASDQVVLNASADLAVALDASEQVVQTGEQLTFQVTVTNNGSSSATGVTIIDVLPAGFEFVSASAPVTVDGATITRTVAQIASGGQETFDLVVEATQPGSLMNSVDAAAGEPDPNPANNEASLMTTVEAGQTGVPDWPGGAAALVLRPNQPNPFTSATRLSWTLPAESPVRLTVHDAAGRLVTVLVDGRLPAGEHSAAWSGTDANGRPLSAGLYFSRLEVEGQVRTGKLLLAR